MLNRLRWLLGLPIPIKVKCSDNDVSLPEYAHKGDSGMDARAHIPQTWRVPPGNRVWIPTGLRVAVPRGFELQVRPRSGLAASGLTVGNTPGTIDATFRDEVAVLVYNVDTMAIAISPHLRIAQLVLCPTARATWQDVDELPESNRNGGFGSTGLF